MPLTSVSAIRFTFSSERFQLLCPDISDFRVARAVATSSAVPVMFAPVVLKNYDRCQYFVYS